MGFDGTRKLEPACRQVAEVAVPKRLFRAILERIRRLRLPRMLPG